MVSPLVSSRGAYSSTRVSARSCWPGSAPGRILSWRLYGDPGLTSTATCPLELQTKVHKDFTITRKAFSLLKATTECPNSSVMFVLLIVHDPYKNHHHHKYGGIESGGALYRTARYSDDNYVH